MLRSSFHFPSSISLLKHFSLPCQFAAAAGRQVREQGWHSVTAVTHDPRALGFAVLPARGLAENWFKIK